MIIKLTDDNIEDAARMSVSVLNNSGIIAYPTETFYGLGVRYDNETALKKLYAIKQRPKDKAMPLIIGSMKQLTILTDSVSSAALELMSKFWPGPLTIVFSARRGFSEYIAPENKIAVRMPGGQFALRLARAAGFPVTATSANISGMPPADSAQMAEDYFNGNLDLIIDAGKTPGTAPSTIVDASGDELRILRKGAVELNLPSY